MNPSRSGLSSEIATAGLNSTLSKVSERTKPWRVYRAPSGSEQRGLAFAKDVLGRRLASRLGSPCHKLGHVYVEARRTIGNFGRGMPCPYIPKRPTDL